MNASVAGERFGFHRLDSASNLPEAWRDLDRAIWRWVLAHGGDATTALYAGWASHAEGQGHSALPLSGIDGYPLPSAEERTALQASPLVASADAAATPIRPFVLDGEYFYLLRNHRSEADVARLLAARRQATLEPSAALSDADLRELFNDRWRDEEERQRAAVRQAPGKRLMVLTGGPGTGKTTTVLRMVLGLSREHQVRSGYLPHLRIAAPTGKAAQRLGESLRQGAELLRAGEKPIAEHWLPHLDAALLADAATVHRLLGSRGRHGGYRFHADEPLPADIVVVDEASMLDLGLLRALLDALREDAVLVLVGDADQLTSVGTGSIMMDIVEALDRDPRDDLVRLHHCFRADATLVPINEAVRSGDQTAFDRAIERASRPVSIGGGPVAGIHVVDDAARLRRRLATWASGLQRMLSEARITTPVVMGDPALIERLQLLRRRQLLCALREGPFGAVQAASVIAMHLRASEELAPWFGQHWYPGRSVIITRNDHAARLYNGDVGLCLPLLDERGNPMLRVAFDPATDSASDVQSASVAMRLFDPNTLPPHEDAFALTIHKSQGSEYEHVAVLLPPDPDSPLLVRQTLYTGLSRARHSLELWSTPASTERALVRMLRRHGRLQERIGFGVDR